MTSRKKLAELIESDDELPSSYNESKFIPAYQDDKRFDSIAIYNLTKDFVNSEKYFSDNSLSLSSCFSDNEDSSDSSQEFEDETETNTTECKQNNPAYLRGVLSRKDAYCIKVFGSVYDDDTLLWFINFTISKDIQSDYKFLISCLVGDVCDNIGKSDLSNNNKIKHQCNTKYSFEYK